MAIDNEMRRFNMTTGTTPDTKVNGIVFQDGTVIFRKYQLGSDAYSTGMQTSITDLAAGYSSNGSYALSYVDPDEPTYTSLTPTGGTTAGGTTVVITGTNLNSASVAVTFGGTTATTIRSNATTISCVTPAKSAGAVDVVITTAEGTVTATGAYTYS